MTSSQQDDILKYFQDGKHKLIIATTVAEEGLDITKCDIVIRYDQVSNVTAMIQARGEYSYLTEYSLSQCILDQLMISISGPFFYMYPFSFYTVPV